METKPESYEDKLEIGNAYSNYICKQWPFLYGKELTFCETYMEQITIGETLQGVEIKHDRRCAETGNLFIEVAEKRRQTNMKWVASGIFRRDNTQWYLIGDYVQFWVFRIETLRTLSYFFEIKTGPTFKGYLLSILQANNCCAKREVLR